MKNKLLLLFLIILQISCSKENSIDPDDGNSGMIKKIIYHKSNNTDETYNFYYTNGDKLKSIIIETDDVSRDFNICKIIFFYDNDLIIKTSVFYDNQTTEEIVNSFMYNNSKIIKYERISKYLGISYLDTFNYNHLPNGNIDRECIYETTSITSNDTIIFDFNNNPSSGGYYFGGNIGYHVFDEKISPFYGIKGLDKIYFVNQPNNFDTFPDYYNNNIGYTNSPNPDPSIFYSFIYNSNNKPLYKYEPNGSLSKEYFYY